MPSRLRRTYLRPMIRRPTMKTGMFRTMIRAPSGSFG